MYGGRDRRVCRMDRDVRAERAAVEDAFARASEERGLFMLGGRKIRRGTARTRPQIMGVSGVLSSGQ
jgi:hypothetical protein